MTVTDDALEMLAGDPVNVRKPGDFYRHATTGAPYVNHPTDTTKAGKPRRVMYGRPSSFGTALDNPYNLIKWKERKLLAGFLLLLKIGLIEVDPDNRDQLDALIAYCYDLAETDLAAKRGTHVHLLCQYHDEGKTWGTLLEAGVQLGIPLLLQCTIVEQWATFRDTLGVDAIGIEMTVVNDRWRLAGTLDRLDVPRRPMLTAYGILEDAFVGDIKTGSLTLGNDGQPNYWVKYPVQLAAYVDAVPYDTDTDTREDWPAPPNPHTAIIYHYDLARALNGELVDWQAIPVSVDAGRDGGDLCRAAADFGKRRDLFAMPAPMVWHDVTEYVESVKFAAPAPPVAVEQPATSAATASTVALVAEYSADPNRLRARCRDLVGNHVAAQELLRNRWPADVPTLKHDGHTPEQLNAILTAVRRVESEVGAQFHPDDMHAADFTPRRR